MTEADWLLSGEPGHLARHGWRGAKLVLKRNRKGYQCFYGWRSEREYVGEFPTMRAAVRAARKQIDAALSEDALFQKFFSMRVAA